MSLVFDIILLIFFNFLNPSKLSDWNFNGLTSDTYYSTVHQSYTYRFNFRKVLPTDSGHNCKDTDCVVEEVYSTSYCYCYGNLTTENVTIFPDDSGIIFAYASNFPTGTPTTGRLILNCAQGQMAYSASFSGNEVSISINATQGCKGSGDSGKKSKMTFGVVIIIIVASIVVLYFAIGIPIGLVQGKKGIQLYIPFFDQVGTFFILVKDGGKFIVNTIICCVRGGTSSASYDSLK